MGACPKDHPGSDTKKSPRLHPRRWAPTCSFPAMNLLTRVLGIAPGVRRVRRPDRLFDGARLLEIGCGTGNLTQKLKAGATGARQLTGMDPDPKALARAGRKFRNVTGHPLRPVGMHRSCPYADESFDRVLSSMMLHHLDDDVKTAAVAEAFPGAPAGRQHARRRHDRVPTRRRRTTAR